jgi:hypothetical protein
MLNFRCAGGNCAPGAGLAKFRLVFATTGRDAAPNHLVENANRFVPVAPPSRLGYDRHGLKIEMDSE